MVFTDTTMYLNFVVNSIYASLSEDKLLEAVDIAMYMNYFQYLVLHRFVGDDQPIVD